MVCSALVIFPSFFVLLYIALCYILRSCYTIQYFTALHCATLAAVYYTNLHNMRYFLHATLHFITFYRRHLHNYSPQHCTPLSVYYLFPINIALFQCTIQLHYVCYTEMATLHCYVSINFQMTNLVYNSVLLRVRACFLLLRT